MTYDKYYKAKELVDGMNYIIDLQCLLENACKDRFLATISDCKYEDARNLVVIDCKVRNHKSLNNDIREKLLQVLRDEHSKLLEEFEAL